MNQPSGDKKNSTLKALSPIKVGLSTSSKATFQVEQTNKLNYRFKHETSKAKVLENGYHSSSIVTAVLWSLDKGSFPHKDKPVGWILF